MKVILKGEVDNLGLAGDVVDVADGYGRNYLIPRGLAILATKGAMKDAEALTRSRKVAESKTLGSAEAAREVLESRTLRIPVRVDERGHLYGSVTSVDVQRVLKERGHEVDRKRIELKGSIKTIGEYEVPIHVHPQVTATVVVEVVDEEGKVIAGAPEPEQAPLPGEAVETPDIVEEALEAAAELEEQEAPAEDTEASPDTSPEASTEVDATDADAPEASSEEPNTEA